MGVYDYHHDSGRSDRPDARDGAPLTENAQEALFVSPYKAYVEVIADFSSAMGLLLAMTGTQSLLLLISTVCFLREVGI